MKGTDVSDEAIQSARSFLHAVSGVDWPLDEELIGVTRSEMIRLIAWYGQIRAGTEKTPGQIVNLSKPERNSE